MIVSINIIFVREPKELLFAIHASQIITICLVQNICNIEKCLQDNEESFLSVHIRLISCVTIDGLA